MSEENEILDRLSVLSDILQVINTSLLLRTTSNDDIINELRRQDREYLEKISKKVDRIEQKLDTLLEKVK